MLPLSHATGSAAGASRPRGVRLAGLGAFTKHEGGAVAVIAGLAIPVLLGGTGLALEYGQMLVVRAEAQRTADLASHAGAVAYAQNGDIGPMVDAATGVARVNGFSVSEIVVVLDTSVSTASGAVVRATITTPKPLYLSSLVGGDTSGDVSASAVAGTLRGKPACVQALDSNGSGIILSGEVSLNANDCTVASNAEVAAPCGTSIITASLSYDSPTAPCDTITTPEGAVAPMIRQPTPDPLQDADVIALARAQMDATSTLLPPDDVVVATGPDIDFGWDSAKTIAQAEAVGCTTSFTSSDDTWTFLCSGQTTVNIGNVTLGGGLTLRFNPYGGESIKYNLSSGIDNGGNRMSFAGGTYNVASGIMTGGGSVTEFGPGTYRISRPDKRCNGDFYSICNTSELTFEGTSQFVLPGGVYNGSERISIDAEDTTFLISANGPEPRGGQSRDQAFCVTAGYNDVHFTAPQSGPYTDLAFVGPLDPARHEGALFAGGASGSEVSGTFYFPNGPITLSGGASASAGDTGCLQLIGTEILMSGGTSIASECNLPGGATQGRVVLLR